MKRLRRSGSAASGANEVRGSMCQRSSDSSCSRRPAAATAAATRAGALQDWYQGMLERGMREELARVTLARKLAALTLRLWKQGDRYDATQLAVQAR